MAFAFTKNPKRNFFFVNAIVEFEEWSIASIIQVVRSRGGVKTLFVNFRINYQKLCDLMRQITKELNSSTVCNAVCGWCAGAGCLEVCRRRPLCVSQSRTEKTLLIQMCVKIKSLIVVKGNCTPNQNLACMFLVLFENYKHCFKN